MALVIRAAQPTRWRYGATALSIALLASGCSALIDSDDVRFASPEAPSAPPRTEGQEPRGDFSEGGGHSLTAPDGGATIGMDAGREDSGTELHSLPPRQATPDAQPSPSPTDTGPPAQPDAAADAGSDAGPEPPPEPGSPLSPELIMTSLHGMR